MGEALRSELAEVEVRDGRRQESHRQNKAAGESERCAAVGRVRATVASVDERDHLPARYCGESRDARGQADDPDILRLELLGRGMRCLREANQRQEAQVALRAGRSTGAADTHRTLVEVS